MVPSLHVISPHILHSSPSLYTVHPIPPRSLLLLPFSRPAALRAPLPSLLLSFPSTSKSIRLSIFFVPPSSLFSSPCFLSLPLLSHSFGSSSSMSPSCPSSSLNALYCFSALPTCFSAASDPAPSCPRHRMTLQLVSLSRRCTHQATNRHS